MQQIDIADTIFAADAGMTHACNVMAHLLASNAQSSKRQLVAMYTTVSDAFTETCDLVNKAVEFVILTTDPQAREEIERLRHQAGELMRKWAGMLDTVGRSIQAHAIIQMPDTSGRLH